MGVGWGILVDHWSTNSNCQLESQEQTLVKSDSDAKIVINENAFGSVVWKKLAILFRASICRYTSDVH